MANYVSKHTGAAIDAAVDKVPVIEEKVTTLTKEIAGGAVNIDEATLNDMLIDKCGDIANYGEFVTALRSENSDPAFIDLGIIEEVNGHKSTDFSFEIKFRVDDNGTEPFAVFGAMPSYSESNFGIYINPQYPVMSIAFGYSATPMVSFDFAEGEVYTVKLSPDGIDVNGASKTINLNTSAIMQGYKSMYLFAANMGAPGAETPARNGGTKSIYDFKVFSGDTLIRHFKPYVSIRGIPCMYDVINDKEYFHAQGNLVVE